MDQHITAPYYVFTINGVKFVKFKTAACEKRNAAKTITRYSEN